MRYRLSFIAVLFAIALFAGFVTNAIAIPEVTLTVLNAPNEYGDVVIVIGNSVEVELTVSDPLNESSSGDVIRLISVTDGSIANQQKRGKELTGSRSFSTQKTTGNDILGELQVQYVSSATGMVIAKSDKTIFLVANKAIVELTERTGATEKKVLEVEVKAEGTKTKMAVLEPKVAQVEQKVIDADAKAAAAKTKADAAEIVAKDAKTKVLIMEPKVTEVETKLATKAEKTIVDEKILVLDAKKSDKVYVDQKDAAIELKKADKTVVETKAEKVAVDANKVAIEKNAQEIVKKVNKTIFEEKILATEEKMAKFAKIVKAALPSDNIIIVAADGSGDFTNPVDAMESIADAAADNTYLMKIMPGTYDISANGPLFVKDYVDIEGSGQASTVIVRNTGGVTGHNISAVYYYGVHNSELRNISVEHNGGGNVFGINVDFGVSPIFKNVDVYVRGGTFNGGFSINAYGSSPHFSTSGPSNPHLENVNIDVIGTQPTIGTDRTTGLYIRNESVPVLKNVSITVSDGNPAYMSSFTLYDTSGLNGVNVQYSDGIINYGTGIVNCAYCYDENYTPY